MRHILHILTSQPDAALSEVLAHQAELPEHQVRRIDLTQPSPDYHQLLEEIFAADSVQVY